jgi:hypothetical protein
LDAAGTVDRHDHGTRFTEIVLKPRLTVVAGTNRERALRLLEKSKTGCLISASLSTPIAWSPESRKVDRPWWLDHEHSGVFNGEK